MTYADRAKARGLDPAKTYERWGLASELLLGGWYAAEHCNDFERQLPLDPEFRLLLRLSEYRASAITAVVLSVAYLEASVNQSYENAVFDADSPNRATDGTRLMSALWLTLASGERHMGTVDKYQVALELSGKQRLRRGENPLQDTLLLIRLTNKLIHYRPEWRDVENRLSS